MAKKLTEEEMREKYYAAEDRKGMKKLNLPRLPRPWRWQGRPDEFYAIVGDSPTLVIEPEGAWGTVDPTWSLEIYYEDFQHTIGRCYPTAPAAARAGILWLRGLRDLVARAGPR